MPLSANSRLGPYEIKSTLGVGGMGEVYRARDSRLNRDVAIKVLREDGTSGRSSLALRWDVAEPEQRPVRPLNPCADVDSSVTTRTGDLAYNVNPPSACKPPLKQGPYSCPRLRRA